MSTMSDEGDDNLYDESDDEDELSRLIREGTVPDPVDSRYQFTFTVLRHYEYETMRQVVGSCEMVGDQQPGLASRPKRRKTSCPPSADTQVGSLKGSLIDRSISPRWSFYELCDSESEELQNISLKFCEDDGTVRYEAIEGLDRSLHGEASTSGFMHLEVVSLHEEHRHHDLGLRFVTALLQWLNQDLETRWTLAVIEPACVNTADDHAAARARCQAKAAGTPLDVAQQEAWTARMSSHKQHTRKLKRQFARLGFTQAAPLNPHWYLVPSKLVFLSKQEVAGVEIDEEPECHPVALSDQPLIDLLTGRSTHAGNLFAAVQGVVAAGANPAAAHALHWAVSSGITDSAVLGQLVALGVSVNDLDAHHNTPLHVAADKTQPSVVRTLLALGASRSLRSLYKLTPFEVAIAKARAHHDHCTTYSLGYFDRDDEQPLYETIQLLMNPKQTELLIDECLSPRMAYRLGVQTSVAVDANGHPPAFAKRVPLPSIEMQDRVWWWDFLPLEVQGEAVYKSFVHGWIQVIDAVHHVLERDHQLPTTDRVRHHLAHGGCYDERYTSYFFQKGGRVEFALDAMLHGAYEQSERYGSGHFEEVFVHMLEKEEEDTLCPRYDQLPTHPFDLEFEIICYKLLGPRGMLTRGPFRND